MSPIDKYLKIKELTPKFTQTSTPARFFSEANLSSIHDGSAIELPEIEKPDVEKPDAEKSDVEKLDIEKPNTSNADTTKPSFIQPTAYVARRRPKPKPGKQLTFSSIEQTHIEKTHDEIVVGEMDISSIRCEHDENEMLNDAEENGEIDNYDVEIITSSNYSNISHNNKTEENIEKTENSKQLISNQLPNTNRSARVMANDSLSWSASSVEKQPQTHSIKDASKEVSIEAVISVSSASSTNSPSTSVASQPKVSVKPRVGFDISNSIHELSIASQQNVSSQKIVMKGGKWRRTIFEARRNNITQCKFKISNKKNVCENFRNF